MIVRGVGRAIAGLALVVAVAGCDDNPLAEGREDAAYLRMTRSNAVVAAQGTVTFVANVLNKHGAAIVVDVTATACDATVSVAADPIRSDYEFPERFVITGNTVGTSCVVVRSGNLTDTVTVRVVPVGIDLTSSAVGGTAISGTPVNLAVAYFNADGAAAPGVSFGPTTTITVSPAASAAVTGTTLTPRSPGTATVVARYADLGVVRVDTLILQVVGGPFNGTVAQSPYTGGGQIATFTAGAVAFDANTSVELVGIPNGVFARVPGSTGLVANLPPGKAVGDTVVYNITNVGPEEFAYRVDHIVTAATAPLNNGTSSTAVPINVGDEVFGIIAGVRGAEVWFTVNVTTAGTYRASFQWGDNQDKDLYVLNSTGGVLVALENAAATNPEAANVNLTPGTYYLVGSTWTPNPGADAYYRLRFTAVVP